MTTDKGRPESRAVEQTEGFEIAAMKDAGIGPVEIAQSGVTPIDVPMPDAGATVNVTIVAGRPLKLAFDASDVKAREVVKDDLVLEFENGGRVVLKEYLTAFGMLSEVRTTIIQPDGKHYAFTELLSPTAGPRKTAEEPAPGTPGDVVIIQKPPAGEKQSFKLTDEKPMALNFGFGHVAKSQVDKDGNLVLTFKDGAVLTLEGYSAFKDNKSIEDGGFEYSTDGGVTWLPATGPNATTVVIPAGQTEIKVRIATFADATPESDESFVLTVANRDVLGNCKITNVVDGYGYIFDDPAGCPQAPEWFIAGPPCLIEEIDPPYTVGISDLALEAGQTRSVEVRMEFLSLHSGHDPASFADLGVPNFLFDALSDAAASETGIAVTNLGNGAVRITFAANASTTQLEFDITAVADDIDEGVEDFRFVLQNSTATNGAQPAVIVPGEGTGFVETYIVEPDDYSVVCGCDDDENRPPEANNDRASADCGPPITIAVLDNDSDPDGDPLRIEAYTSAFNGTLVNNGDGTFTYAPFADFTGTDTFSYAISDGNDGIDTAVVRIRVEEGEVCDCDIPPPPVCDGPGGKWSGRNGGERNAGTQSALAALMGLPLSEQIGEQGEQSQERAWNGQQSGRGDEHRREGGRNGRHGDDRGRGEERDGGESGWRCSHWNGDQGGGRSGDHGWRGGDYGGRNGDGQDWKNAGDDASEGARTQGFGPGQSQASAAPIVGTPGADELVGTVAGETLIGGAGDDVIIGGGGADVLRGGAGDDVLVAKAGFAEFHGGAGFDTFKFDDSGVLDLALLAGKVTGIEQADISATGNVELKLTFQDLLTMTDSGHQLTILGDSGDKVSADFTGHCVSVADMGSFTRYIIDGGAATLDIDNIVQKNFIGI